MIGVLISGRMRPVKVVRRPGVEPGSAGLKGRCSDAIELATHETGWKGRIRTGIRHINSVFTYRMVHFPKNVAANGSYESVLRDAGRSNTPAPLELHSALAGCLD